MKDIQSWLKHRSDFSIEQVLIKNINRLQEFPHISHKEKFIEIHKELTELNNQGKINNEFISAWWQKSIPSSRDQEIGMWMVSMAYTVMAEREIYLNKLQNAWPLISHASYFCGMAEGLYTKVHENPLAGQARKGGDAKAEQVQPIKDEIVRLLSMPPPPGWGTTRATADKLVELLAPFLKSNPEFSRKLPDLIGTIERWIKDNKYNTEIRKTYILNKKNKYTF